MPLLESVKRRLMREANPSRLGRILIELFDRTTDIVYGVAGESLNSGDFVGFKKENDVLTVYKAIASVDGIPCEGYILDSYVENDVDVKIYLSGINNRVVGTDIQIQYYLSDTDAGKFTSLPVSGSDKIHQVLGKGASTTTIRTQIQEPIILA